MILCLKFWWSDKNIIIYKAIVEKRAWKRNVKKKLINKIIKIRNIYNKKGTIK